MSNKTLNTGQGHWVLARMGKKVLRPGGRELTEKMIENLNIGPDDEVVEFAPGLGLTAAVTLKKKPRSYTGIELNEEAASILKKAIHGDSRTIITANASATGLADGSYSRVYGEAMLTMQADSRKAEIIREAYRILKPDGLYGIHELGLQPDDMPEKQKNDIQKELARAIRVNARPLTLREWSGILEQEGFHIIRTETSPMHLLEKKRVLADEGFFRTLKIIFNILTHPQERRRIVSMREAFRKNRDHLNAISIVAVKKISA